MRTISKGECYDVRVDETKDSMVIYVRTKKGVIIQAYEYKNKDSGYYDEDEKE